MERDHGCAQSPDTRPTLRTREGPRLAEAELNARCHAAVRRARRSLSDPLPVIPSSDSGGLEFADVLQEISANVAAKPVGVARGQAAAGEDAGPVERHAVSERSAFMSARVRSRHAAVWRRSSALRACCRSHAASLAASSRRAPFPRRRVAAFAAPGAQSVKGAPIRCEPAGWLGRCSREAIALTAPR